MREYQIKGLRIYREGREEPVLVVASGAVPWEEGLESDVPLKVTPKGNMIWLK